MHRHGRSGAAEKARLTGTSPSVARCTRVTGEALPENPRTARANALLERAWRSGWAQRPSLEPDALLAAARRSAGDPGPDDDGWRTRLDILCGALESEAGLTALGRTIAHGQLVAALANRARAQALWRQRPDILRTPIAAPVVIVGQMRSGSTRMQRLLACDPRLSWTRFHESWNPLPRWPMPAPLDDRVLRGQAALLAARTLDPGFSAIHPTGVFAPDEEIGFFSPALFGAAFEAQWRVPSFARHCEEDDAVPVYRTFRRLLQTVACLRGGPEPRPWVLKVPQFTQDLDAMLQAFPDARLICLHRDPAAIVGSSASLMARQMQVQSERVDRRWIGSEALRKACLRAGRTATALRRSHAPRAHVEYRELDADWRTVMERVYALLGMPLLPEVARRMARFIACKRHRALARHRYALADYVLEAERVRSAFAQAEAEFAALNTARTLAVATSSSTPTPQIASPSGPTHST